MFDIRTNNNAKEILKEGSILVSEPFLNEFFFKRSCILMAKMTRGNPSVGFVLNNRTEFLLDELLNGINISKKIPVFCGGPLSLDRLFYIHDIQNLPEAIPIANGLFLNGNLNSIIDYVNSSSDCDRHIKFFVGYSGWDPGQIEDELTVNTWAVLPYIDNSFILNYKTDNNWEYAVKLLGDDFANWLLIPAEPMLN